MDAWGSPTKVGYYQNLSSSPFWNGDAIWSNGERTIDFSATGSDDETSDGRLHYFGSHLEADLGYERFQQQLDVHNFAGFNYNGVNNSVGPGYAQGTGTLGSGPGDPQNPGSIILYSQNNLSPGQDYAMRVQEYKANFKGNLTENLKWRVNVFGIDKEGERQVSEFTHCSAAAGNGSNLPAALPLGGVNYVGGVATPKASASNPTAGVPAADGNLTSQCHVTTQAQHIDWQTTEVTPSLELKMGCDTYLEYSHTVRAFTANDDMVTYNYDASSSFSMNPTAVTAATSTASTAAARQTAINNLTAGYGIVPDSQTQIDRLKFSSKIGADTDVYLLGYGGYNEDMLRDTYRDFSGADLRITNKSIDNLAITTYGKFYSENTTSPLSPLSPTPTTANTQASNFYQEPGLGSGPQIDRQVAAFGINDRWRPFADDWGTLASKLSIVSGWEYSSLKRSGDSYSLTALPAGTNAQFISNSVFTQPDSDKNTFTVGAEEKWSETFNTFLRYKFIGTTYPLYGVMTQVGQVAAALNSNLPTQENRVELGCTWTPTDELMVNATLYVENAMSDAPYVAWTSNSVPFTVSAWWAPTQQWSFSAGAAEMDSWINQNTTLSNLNATPGATVSVPWQYTGVADVFNLGTRFQATEKLSFNGELEWVRGMDESGAIVNPNNQVSGTPPAWKPYGNPPYATYDIGQYSLVKMQSFRMGIGADYLIRPRVTTYVRYNYYDYQDESGITSGTASMILGGMSATF